MVGPRTTRLVGAGCRTQVSWLPGQPSHLAILPSPARGRFCTGSTPSPARLAFQVEHGHRPCNSRWSAGPAKVVCASRTQCRKAQAAITISRNRCAQSWYPETTLLLKQLPDETLSGHQYQSLLELRRKRTCLVTNPSPWHFAF